MTIDNFLSQLSVWGAERGSIYAIGIVGSYARNEARADSDIDVVIVDQQPNQLLEDHSWAGRFGKLMSFRKEQYGLVTSLRCWYDPGPEIEFGIAGESWFTPPIDQGTAEVMRNGVMVIYDPLQELQKAIEWVERGPTKT